MKARILLLTAIFFMISFIQAQIIHVPGDYNTIQEGINAALAGDTVLVANGLYYENFNFSGKAITVASNFIVTSDTNDINNTIINGSQPDNPDYGSVVTFINAEDTTSVLCGFTITGGTGMLDPIHDARIGGGIVCYYSTAKIVHNIITGNELNSNTNSWGAGIASIKETGTNWTIVENNIISSNQSIANNSTATGGGLEIWGNARICNNVIEYNECHCVNGVAGGGGVVMESINTTSDTLKLCNNMIRNNLIHSDNSWSPGAGVFSLYSYCLIINNIIENNQAQGLTYAHGGGVEVQYADIMLSSNVIRNNTVVSNDGSYGGGASFWNSNAHINDNEISGNSVSAGEADGGGIHLYQTGKVEVTDNMINYNSTITNNTWLGAGIVCLFPGDTSKFIKNNFVGNAGRVYPSGAGGGLCVWDAQETNILVDGNRFLNDTAYNGGGFYERNSYNLLISNNIFSGNSGNYAAGIALYHPSAGRLTENRASLPRIINNTFVSNSAISQGGAVRFQGDINLPVTFNNIFWDNEAIDGPDIKNLSNEDITVSYSDINTNGISGNWGGINNIFEDPGFINDTVHISPESPCFNTGTNMILINDVEYFCPFKDYQGDPRPSYGIADIGADEFFNVGLHVNNLVSEAKLKLNAYPNPFTASTTIEFNIPYRGFARAMIYDMLGNEIDILINEHLTKRDYLVNWNTSHLSPGIYYLKFSFGSVSETIKLIRAN